MSDSSEESHCLEGILLPDTGFIRQKTVLKLIPVSKTTWWRWVQEGKAPRAIKIGEKTTVWKAEDIRELINNLSKSQ